MGNLIIPCAYPSHKTRYTDLTAENGLAVGLQKIRPREDIKSASTRFRKIKVSLGSVYLGFNGF